MQCELCGKECGCRPADVDGVRMMLCPDCMRHGHGVKTSPESPATYQKPILERIKRPKTKDVYKDMNKELVSGWSDLIKNASAPS